MSQSTDLETLKLSGRADVIYLLGGQGPITCMVILAGTLLVVSSQLNMDSFLEMTIFSSAAKYSKGKMNLQLKLPSPVRER